MSFYDDMAAVSLKLITDFGQPVSMTLKGSPAGDLDPITGEPSPEVPDVLASGNGVKLNYKKFEIDGENIIAGDCKLKYVGETPIIGMITTIDGEDWRVMQPNPINPAGTVLLYDMQLRRG